MTGFERSYKIVTYLKSTANKASVTKQSLYIVSRVPHSGRLGTMFALRDLCRAFQRLSAAAPSPPPQCRVGGGIKGFFRPAQVFGDLSHDSISPDLYVEL